MPLVLSKLKGKILCSQTMYIGKSISKLQIQVATHVFELSVGNCHH